MEKTARKLPDGFLSFVEDVISEAEAVEGFLSPAEMRFLALLGAVPTASGEVLEIGSFKGRSTIILAKSSVLAGERHINAVDPMTAPSVTDPDLGGSDSSFDDFTRNVNERGVADRVRLHRKLSSELAREWTLPLRLLWIDGDHTYAGTRLDLECFRPHLADGAIVAFHDVLHEFEGGVRVFMEDVLLSPHFGAAGFCGSIAWSQFHKDPLKTTTYRPDKIDLYRKLGRLVPFLAFGQPLKGFRKKIYKLHRSRVPHGPVDPEKWLSSID